MKNVITFILLVDYAFYALFSVLIPPLFHPNADPDIEIPAASTNEDYLILVDDNTDALLWRLRLIDSAQDEIIYSTFDFAVDDAGIDILAALQAAADRGVNIKLIVDGMSGRSKLRRNASFQGLLLSPQVEARFNKEKNGKRAVCIIKHLYYRAAARSNPYLSKVCKLRSMSLFLEKGYHPEDFTEED